MRTTFILELEPELVEFIYNQPEFSDPSNFVNHVLREEKTRKVKRHFDETHAALEEFLDQDTVAAD